MEATAQEPILVVDDEPEICEALSIVLSEAGHNVTTETDSVTALERLGEHEFAVVITDIKMKGADGHRVIRETSTQWPDTQVIVITSYGSIAGAVEAMRLGASNYITKPFVNEEIRMAVKRALDKRQLTTENRRLREEILSAKAEMDPLVGRSEPFRRLLDMVRRIAPSRANVFITGASGTGKGLIGRVIHENSPRRAKPYVTINCGAIPGNLLESELFGHRRGAFTSAYENKEGLFKIADGGTVLLDEVGEMPPGLQVKLLNALQDREFTPMGATRPVQVDIRVLAATNADVVKALEDGRLREDLYYRLNVFELHVPTLAERIEDIPLLVHHFIRKVSDETELQVSGIEPEALARMSAYLWPGNIRELENVVERAATLAVNGAIQVRDLPGRLVEEDADGQPVDLRLREATKRFERKMIVRALKSLRGDKDEAAKALGIDLATLYRKLDRLGIDKATGR